MSLVVGAAGSAFALSGTAAASVHAAPASSGTAPIAAVTTAATRTLVTQDQRSAGRSSYTVISGDTLSGISSRFCGTPADYPALAAASRIADPDVIHVGQKITLACHAAAAHARTTAAVSRDSDGDGSAAPAASGSSSASRSSSEATGQPARASAATSGGGVSTAGMSAFEACVISRESGGNPKAVNPSSGAGGLFQFLPSTWAALGFAAAYPGGAQTAPVRVQQAAFAKLHAQAGTSPWAPYDGC